MADRPHRVAVLVLPGAKPLDVGIPAWTRSACSGAVATAAA